MADSSFAVRKMAFSAGEFARITGVSTALQRDWRRRGILSSQDAPKAKTPLEEVCRAMALRQCVEAGIPPSAAEGIAERAGNILMFHAMVTPHAIHDPHNLLDNAKTTGEHLGLYSGERRSEWARFLVSTEDGIRLAANLNEVQATRGVFLDLKALGELAARRAGRPLVEIVAA